MLAQPSGGSKCEARKSLLRSAVRGRVPDVILDRRDKTYFNDATLSNIDYLALRHWVLDGDERIPGVRYDLLRERLEHEQLGIIDYVWAHDLAVAHAFLASRADASTRGADG